MRYGVRGETVTIRLAFIAVCAAFMLPAVTFAAETPATYTDSDTEKPCGAPGESPECAAKTFWLCSEKSVATCKLAGLTVQADGAQHKEDGTVASEAWVKPWTWTWTSLLAVTHADYTVWQIEGFREVTQPRLRGVPGNRRALTGSHELMIKMVNADGKEEKESVFLVQKKGVWSATGYAKWLNGEAVNACEKRKLGSLACRYTVLGLTAWDLTPPAPKP